MKYLLICMILSACAMQPLTPEQQRAQNVQSHCRNVATAASAGLRTQQQQAGPTVGFYGGMAVARDTNAAYDAAYVECLQRNGYDPL